MTIPIELKPTSKARVYDLVSEAGVDVSDWANFKGGPARAASNPKYCYEWAYLEPKKVVVLNLWYSELKECDGEILEHRNMRAKSFHISSAAEQNRRRRIRVMEDAIAAAVEDELPVRVIICDGNTRGVTGPDDKASQAKKRMLDPLPWTIRSFDALTGEYTIVRGSNSSRLKGEREIREDLERRILRSRQDSSRSRRKRLAIAVKVPPRIEVRSTAFVRNADVIVEVLERADGRCEGCQKQAPFMKKSNGTPYLEVHHKIHLANGGHDTVDNALALCPNCHRHRHYG